MNKKNVKILSMALLAFWAQNVYANLDLETAIQEAKLNNPALQKLASQNENIKFKKQEMFGAFLPKVNLKADHFIANKFETIEMDFMGRTIEFPAEYPSTTLTLEGSWLLFDGFNNYHNYKSINAEVEAVSLQYERASFQLEEEIKLKFYQSLSAQFLAEVAEQNVNTLEEHLTDVKLREKTGFSTRFDVLRIDVQLDEAKNEKILSDDLMFITKTKLAQAMGKEIEERKLNGVLPTPNKNLISENINLNVSNRQDISALIKQEEGAMLLGKAAKSHYLPKFSFFANTQEYNMVNKSLFDTSKFKNAYAFGFNVTWNIFDGFSTYSRDKEAFYKTEEISKSLQSALIQAKTDFQIAKKKYFYGLSLYQARLRSIGKAEESVRLAKIGVKAGTRTNMELLDAELDLMKTRAGVIRAQTDAIEAIINLESVLGLKVL